MSWSNGSVRIERRLPDGRLQHFTITGKIVVDTGPAPSNDIADLAAGEFILAVEQAINAKSGMRAHIFANHPEH